MYDLPHDELRQGQEETIEKLLNLDNDQVVIEAATGFGKTALPAAVSSQHTVTTLCRTKMLQVENYQEAYSFDALFGRANYPCAYDVDLTAAGCEYAEKGMNKCPEASKCEYMLQKKLVKSSRKRSLNYAYWLAAKNWREIPTDFLFLDEAHLLPDIVVDWAGCTITQKDSAEWNLPRFPEIKPSGKSMLFESNPEGDALKWLEESRGVLLVEYKKLSRLFKSGDQGIKKRLRKCETFGMKIRATIDALRSNADDWFIVSGNQARMFRGKKVPGFCCKPLTARHHFSNYFVDGWKLVLMSATIGDVQTLADELGLSSPEPIIIPSNWEPDMRPVIVPKNAPRLGRSSDRDGGTAYEEQADIIANLIFDYPGNWAGVIHVSSKVQARRLVNLLARRDLHDRVWLPPDVGTDKQLLAWQEVTSKRIGMLAVTYSWHEGVDLCDEKISIVAKVPFPSLGDPFEKARLKYSNSFYQLRTAWQLQQACGRTRRGRLQDYDTNGKKNGLVAIVDGNWTRVRKYLSDDFLASIVEV